MNGQALQLNYADATAPLKTEVSQVRPWVRYWARSIDIFLFAIATGVVFGMILTPDNVLDVARAAYLFFGFGIFIVWMFVEAAFLSFFGWTPGKWLLRTSVESADGGTPSYIEALSRSGNVWFRGLAAGIPFIAAGTQINSYRNLKKCGQTTWDRDGGFIVIHERIGAARAWFVVASCVAVFLFAALSEDRLTPLAMDTLAATKAEPTRQSNMFDQFDHATIIDPFAPKPNSVHPQNEAATRAANSAASGPWVQYQTSAETATGEGREERCNRNDPQTGQCLEWVAPPAGFHWDNAPLPNQVIHQVDVAAESARWPADVSAFIQQHPSLTYRQNTQLMQEHLDAGPTAGLTNLQMLNAAFYAAEADSRWSNGP
jgi:hypothetical protein